MKKEEWKFSCSIENFSGHRIMSEAHAKGLDIFSVVSGGRILTFFNEKVQERLVGVGVISPGGTPVLKDAFLMYPCLDLDSTLVYGRYRERHTYRYMVLDSLASEIIRHIEKLEALKACTTVAVEGFALEKKE